jgi:hypothetical protein
MKLLGLDCIQILFITIISLILYLTTESVNEDNIKRHHCQQVGGFFLERAAVCVAKDAIIK